MPVCPATARSPRRTAPIGVRASSASRSTTSYGEVWSASGESPSRRRSGGGCRAARRSSGARPPPRPRWCRRRRSRAPRSLTSVSAKKLSDGGSVSPSSVVSVGDWTSASWVAPAGVLAAPLRRGRDAVARSAAQELVSGVGGGGVRAAFGAGFAAVEGERAEGAFEERVERDSRWRARRGASRSRTRRPRSAGDAVDAVGADELAWRACDRCALAAVVAVDEGAASRRWGRRRRAGRGCLPRRRPAARWPLPSTVVLRRASGPMQLQRGGGRVELLDRGRRRAASSARSENSTWCVVRSYT